MGKSYHSYFNYILYFHNSNSDVVVKLLLQHSSDPAAVDVDKNTPLHFASREGYLNIAKLLVESSKDVKTYVNLPNENKEIALHLAARGGKLEVVKLLIAFLSDRRLEDKDGKTAKQLAIDARHREIKLIFEKFEDAEKEGAYVEISNDPHDIHSLAFKNDGDSIVNVLQVKLYNILNICIVVSCISVEAALSQVLTLSIFFLTQIQGGGRQIGPPFLKVI